MNCCDDNGMCTRSQQCPAGPKNLPEPMGSFWDEHARAVARQERIDTIAVLAVLVLFCTVLFSAIGVAIYFGKSPWQALEFSWLGLREFGYALLALRS